ncbi:carboxylesterase/lipase family protein [Dyella sp. A6]|uniref:carboxylesterase/lipase family protein n=1 Tax=Dyella aluminiiresistens TaxID=3069105 RepID=UPI002E79A8F1|nr:carboxylesterase family protein [Dyella sp. A6]
MSYMGKFTKTVLSMAILAAAGPVLAGTTGPEVTVANGTLQGSVSDGVASFKGIPYAAPPIGNLRWHAPQPAASWSGVRLATKYEPDCKQTPFPSDAAPLGVKTAENCLYANVWRPAGDVHGKLPVMVWIYGGGFMNGGSSPPTYTGADLAKKGIVVVSFNYRVGRFGFFGFPQLEKEEAASGEPRVNFGLMDQVAALKWIKHNVAAFGGNPNDITVVGQSAGGMSVNVLLTSPESRGLFEKAVIWSGSNGQMHLTPAQADAAGIAFAKKMGINPDSPDALKQLRALSANQVDDGLNMMALFKRGKGPATFTMPVVDGKVNVGPWSAYQSGNFAKVPVMIGATNADMGGRDGFMIKGARDIATTLTKQGVPVYYYRFDYVASSMQGQGWYKQGAPHASDIPFWFDTEAIKYGKKTTIRDREVGKLASNYLVNFVKTGNPNGKGLHEWPIYNADKHSMLTFTAKGGVISGSDPWSK